MSDHEPISLVGQDALGAMRELIAAGPKGIIVEVGVFQGGSAYQLAKTARAMGVDLHLFDTFTGIPIKDEIDGHNVGDFSDTTFELVRGRVPDAVFHVGIFPDTLTDDVTAIAAVHVDCDQYRSIRACVEYLGPRMLPGGKMFFDDHYFPGAVKALEDCGFKMPERTTRAAPFLVF